MNGVLLERTFNIQGMFKCAQDIVVKQRHEEFKQKILTQCRGALEATDTLEVIEDLGSVNLNAELHREYTSFDAVEYKKLVDLQKRLKDACAELKRFSKYRNESIKHAIFVDNLLYS